MPPLDVAYLGSTHFHVLRLGSFLRILPDWRTRHFLPTFCISYYHHFTTLRGFLPRSTFLVRRTLLPSAYLLRRKEHFTALPTVPPAVRSLPATIPVGR